MPASSLAEAITLTTKLHTDDGIHRLVQQEANFGGGFNHIVYRESFPREITVGIVMFDTKCARCMKQANKTAYSYHGPSHDGSEACRNHTSLRAGGKVAHCTCAGCF